MASSCLLRDPSWCSCDIRLNWITNMRYFEINLRVCSSCCRMRNEMISWGFLTLFWYTTKCTLKKKMNSNEIWEQNTRSSLMEYLIRCSLFQLSPSLCCCRIQCDAYATEPAFDAILGQRSAHSFATGPVIADPFISPLLFTITPALSSKYMNTPSLLRNGLRCRMTTAGITWSQDNTSAKFSEMCLINAVNRAHSPSFSTLVYPSWPWRRTCLQRQQQAIDSSDRECHEQR